MRRMLVGVVVAVAALAAGGGATAAREAPEAQEEEQEEEEGEAQEFVETRLLFGTARPDGGQAVTEKQFEAFVDDVVTPRFPAGLTVQEGYGQWREKDGDVVRERSYELILYYPEGEEGGSDLEIEEIRETYVKRFGQESVGRVDGEVEVVF